MFPGARDDPRGDTAIAAAHARDRPAIAAAPHTAPGEPQRSAPEESTAGPRIDASPPGRGRRRRQLQPKPLWPPCRARPARKTFGISRASDVELLRRITKIVVRAHCKTVCARIRYQEHVSLARRWQQ